MTSLGSAPFPWGKPCFPHGPFFQLVWGNLPVPPHPLHSHEPVKTGS